MQRTILGAAFAALMASPLAAQRPAQPSTTDSSLLSVERIYSGAYFAAQPFGPARWLADGRSYTTLERVQGGRGRDIVKYDAHSGAREVLVAAARLQAPGDTMPMAIENYAWAPDMSKVLIYTNSEQVWRTNDRGDYWVLDVAAGGRLRKLGGPAAKPSTLMFAKFSPDGGRVGYVRERNLYIEDLATGRITQLTRDGSNTRTNGSFDWVYEEELGLHDGWRWSPDGRQVAYWQLDIDGVRDFPMINTTDSLYAFVVPVQYPKAGEANSAGRLGVVNAAGGVTRWMAVPGDPRNNYIARMTWTGAEAGPLAGRLLVQHLNRLQNELNVLLADPRTGAVRTLFTESDPRGWVEQLDQLQFVNGGRDLLWQSDRSGWTHLWLMAADGGAARPVTQGNWDVLSISAVDTSGGWVYYIASPENPTQRYLHRARLDGTGAPERLSPAQPGSHGYNMSAGARFAFHTFSSFGNPAITELVSLPGHGVVRPLVENTQLRQRVAALRRGPSEFFQVDVGGGTRLNGWMIKPPDFDASRRYPVLFFVYGGPGSQTVLDSWGGSTWLWHSMLAQKGYIVASVDNRGTGARGRDFMKVIYGQLGVIETQDQIAAARAIGRWSFVDSTRLGIWGWSYGGFMSLNGITQGADVYRAAIAVAPVTHWKYYDNIYTERYNGLPQQNAAGYDRGSPITYARNLRGELLIVHGTGDDNVHAQNTEAMVNALVAANRPFHLMEYPNRTHSISGGSTTVHLRSLLTRFLEERLPPGPAPGTRPAID